MRLPLLPVPAGRVALTLRSVPAAGCVLLAALIGGANAASNPRPAPAGAPPGAPGEYTRFTPGELQRGFMAVAFGSTMHIGRPVGIHRHESGARVYIASTSRTDRRREYREALERNFATVPHLAVTVVDREQDATIVVHLLDEAKFARVLADVVGGEIASRFIRRHDPQCVTRTRSFEDGTIDRADAFIIADQDDETFLDCAFHETLHAFGLGSHDDTNPWTTLNQERSVGYLSVYDRAMLTLLYDPRLKPAMSRPEVRAILPGVIRDLCARGRQARSNQARSNQAGPDQVESDQVGLDCIAP